MSKQSIVVFDLGGVLVDWDPRYLFMKMKRPEGVTEDIEWFLGHVCTQAWNEQMDEGLPFREGLAQLSPQFPAWRDWIEAYHARWVEMLGGEIGGTVEILNRLSARG
ncbi:MAG: HAD family hydrolase, partial [Bacteriovoracia bacterium]